VLLAAGACFRWEVREVDDARIGQPITRYHGVVLPWQPCGASGNGSLINFHVRHWLCYGLIKVEATGQTMGRIRSLRPERRIHAAVGCGRSPLPHECGVPARGSLELGGSDRKRPKPCERPNNDLTRCVNRVFLRTLDAVVNRLRLQHYDQSRYVLFHSPVPAPPLGNSFRIGSGRLFSGQ